MLYMLKSVGCAGMVLFMQELSVYFHCFLIVHNHVHFPYSKHSTPSSSMYHMMQMVPTAKWSYCVLCPLNFNL